jgi:hypothetical protein
VTPVSDFTKRKFPLVEHYLDLGVVELLVNVVEAAVVAFLIDTVLKWMTRTELVDVKRAEAEVSDVVE